MATRREAANAAAIAFVVITWPVAAQETALGMTISRSGRRRSVACGDQRSRDSRYPNLQPDRCGHRLAELVGFE